MKISLITVTYNRGYIIRDAIDSVLSQKYKNYEYIVVDGASTDDTKSILKSYEDKFEGRLKWVSEPDNGLYDAINKGIKMASGDVVGILNSDDFFHRDDVFNIIATGFTSSNIDVIFGDERIVKPESLDRNYRFEAPWYFRPWMFRIGLEPPHPTFYARRSLFEQYGYYCTDYVISADFELMMRFLLIAKLNYKYIHQTFLTFRNSGISTNSSNRLLMNREIVRACKENGVFTCLPMVYLKYFFKIPELFIGNNRH